MVSVFLGVPIRTDSTGNDRYLLMGRVVPLQWYKAWFDNRPCLSDMRDLVIIDSSQWCVMDEMFYIYPCASSSSSSPSSSLSSPSASATTALSFGTAEFFS
jgi:hypothetical protein